MRTIHVLHQPGAGQRLLEIVGQKLYAAITVRRRAGRWLTAAQGA